MKKFFLCFSFILYFLSGSSQQLTFNNTFGDLNFILETSGTSVEISGTGYMVPYDSWKFATDSSLIGIAILDYSGSMLNTKYYGNDSIAGCRVRSIVKSSDGNYIIAGNYRVKPSQNVYGFIYKINSAGDTLWTKTYSSGQLITVFTVIIETKDNNLIVTGFSQDFQGTTYYQSQIYVLKTDSIGNYIWDIFLGNSTDDEYATSIIELADSSLIISGYRYVLASGFNKGLIFKLNKDGTFIKQKNITSVNDLALTDGVLASDGNIYISGEYVISQNPPYNYLGYIIKLDTALNIIWSDSIGYSQQLESFNGIKENSKKQLVVAGTTTYQSPNLNQSGWFVAYDTSGIALWERIIAPPQFHTCLFYSIIHTSDEGYLLTGTAHVYDTLNSNWNQQVWVVKVDSLGCDIDGCPTILWTSVEELTVSSQNPLVIYPNPFTDFTTIEYAVSSVEDSWIIIYDVTGKVVKRVKLNNQTGKVEVEAAELNNGVYFCQLISHGEIKQNAKLILTK